MRLQSLIEESFNYKLRCNFQGEAELALMLNSPVAHAMVVKQGKSAKKSYSRQRGTMRP